MLESNLAVEKRSDGIFTYGFVSALFSLLAVERMTLHYGGCSRYGGELRRTLISLNGDRGKTPFSSEKTASH